MQFMNICIHIRNKSDMLRYFISIISLPVNMLFLFSIILTALVVEPCSLTT